MRTLMTRLAGARRYRVGILIVCVYALCGFVLLPALVKYYVPKYSVEQLQRQASIGAVRINPFLFKVDIQDFALQEADGRAIVAFKRLFIDFETSSLLRWAWSFAELRVEGLELQVATAADGRNNLAELATHFSSDATDDAEPAGAVPRFLLAHIALSDAVLTYSDATLKTPASATLRPINIDIRNVTTLPEQNGSYTVSAELDSGARALLRGALSVQPFSVAGSLDIQAFPLASAWHFYRDQLRIDEPKGVLGLQLGYRYGAANGGTNLLLHAMQLRGADIDIRREQAGSPLLALQSLEIASGEFDLERRMLKLPQITLAHGQVGVTLAANGSTDWGSLLVATPAAAPAPTPSADVEPHAPWQYQLSDVQLDNIAVQYADHARPTPLSLVVKQLGARFAADITVAERTMVFARVTSIDLARLALTALGEKEPLATLGAVQLKDAVLDTGKRDVAIAAIALREGDTRIERDAQGVTRLFTALASAPDADEKATAQAESSGWTFSLANLQLEKFRVAYADQSFKPALAYDLDSISAKLQHLSNDVQQPVSFQAAVQVAQGGTLNATGEFAIDGASARAEVQASQIALTPLRPLLARHAALELKAGVVSADLQLEHAAQDAVLTARGEASIADLLIDETVGGDRFLEWRQLAADGIAYTRTAEQDALEIAALQLTEPGAKLLIYKDRSTNVSKVFEQGEADADAATQSTAKAAAAADAHPFPISIKQLRVEKGVVDYSDQSLVLPFATQIREFKGTVTGISSDRDSRARLDFDGRVDKYGQAKVRGSLSPFAPKRFTDIRTEFINIDMPPLSPYSATFAGRKIASGKLSLDLEYKIKDSVLAGDNKVLLDKFTLGENIDSPDALDLPLDLAVALLTDAQGRIDVAVPVKGDMNSPTFDLGGVIGQAVTRMLTRIITAPFSALGNLLGGAAAQSNAIAFEAGSSVLQPPQQEKLVAVGKALSERPQLTLVVGGRYALKQDGAALRSMLVRRALAAELDIQLAASDLPAPVDVEQAQTQRALETLLEQRAGDKAVDVFQSEYEKQAGRPVERVNPMLGLLGQASPDREFYTAVFDRLVALQPLAEAELQTLARQRADAVMRALVEDAGVDATRVSSGKPAAVEAKQGAAVETQLTLDVQKTNK